MEYVIILEVCSQIWNENKDDQVVGQNIAGGGDVWVRMGV